APEIDAAAEVDPAAEIDAAAEVDPAAEVDAAAEIDPAPDVDAAAEIDPAAEIDAVGESGDVPPAADLVHVEVGPVVGAAQHRRLSRAVEVDVLAERGAGRRDHLAVRVPVNGG